MYYHSLLTKRCLIGAILAMALPSAATAGIYNPVSSWNPNVNSATSLWQYGTSTTLGGPITLFSLHGEQSAPPTYDWWSFNGAFTGPVIAFNSSGGTIVLAGLAGDPNSIVWTEDQLLIAPGGKNGTPQFSILRWVAPATDIYDIDGRFSDLQRASVSVNVLLDGSSLFAGSYSGAFAHQGDRPFSFQDLALTQGQVIDFVVGSGGNDGDDVLGISATIASAAAAVPQPSSAVLMGSSALIFGLCRLVRRRTLQNE